MNRDQQINELFEQNYEVLFRYCLSALDGDERAAMDAVDTVFVIVKEKASSLDNIDDTKRWIMTIATNTVNNIRRMEKRYRKRFILFNPGSYNGEAFSGDHQLSQWEKRIISSWRVEEEMNNDDVSDEEICRLKDQFLQSLSEADRELLSSYYEHGVSTKELAEKYGRSQDTIRIRLSRISIKLIERIKIYFQN